VIEIIKKFRKEEDSKSPVKRPKGLKVPLIRVKKEMSWT